VRVVCPIPDNSVSADGRLREQFPAAEKPVPALAGRLGKLQTAVIDAAVREHAVRVVQAGVVLNRTPYDVVEALLEHGTKTAHRELASLIRIDREREGLRE